MGSHLGVESSQATWVLPEPEPTTLIALWPGLAAPTKFEVVAAIGEGGDCALEQIEELPNRDDVLWNAVFRTGLAESPVILWAEPAKPVPAGELDDAEVQGCKWIMGVELVLSRSKALREYLAVLRALASSLDAPAILDPITQKWFVRQELADLIASPPAEPDVEILWTIQAVADHSGNENGERWLHTHGLWRCGVAELEMLEVPTSRMGPAGALLNEIAIKALDGDLPKVGELLVVGPQLEVSLHPWETLARQVSPPNSGGPSDRNGDDDPHAGLRGVICGANPEGVFDKRWRWPQTAVEAFERGDAIVFRGDGASQARARLARQRWDDLATAFAAMSRHPEFLKGDRVAFGIKAGFAADDGDPDHREHIWLKPRRFDGDRAEVEVVSEPLTIATLQVGSIIEVKREALSDWLINTPAGRFGPNNIPAMWRAIREIQQGASR
ncbi:MAG: DUF4026 domain-containing protein [Phycisphaerales bacterium]|nr:DUF4026 domain-containing protein [Phycisphaerales bacterium]